MKSSSLEIDELRQNPIGQNKHVITPARINDEPSSTPEKNSIEQARLHIEKSTRPRANDCNHTLNHWSSTLTILKKNDPILFLILLTMLMITHPLARIKLLYYNPHPRAVYPVRSLFTLLSTKIKMFWQKLLVCIEQLWRVGLQTMTTTTTDSCAVTVKRYTV